MCTLNLQQVFVMWNLVTTSMRTLDTNNIIFIVQRLTQKFFFVTEPQHYASLCNHCSRLSSYCSPCLMLCESLILAGLAVLPIIVGSWYNSTHSLMRSLHEYHHSETKFETKVLHPFARVIIVRAKWAILPRTVSRQISKSIILGNWPNWKL